MSQNSQRYGQPAGELHRAHQIALERDQVVGRDRKFRQRQPLVGLEDDLPGRWRHALVQRRDQGVGAVAQLPHMQVVELRIHLGRGRDRGPAQHRDLAGRLRAGMDVAHLRGLDVHGRDHHRVRPGEFGRGRRPDVLVDEADLPGFRHIGRDQQEALRRHEGPHPAHQPVGVVEGAEGRRVARKDTENPTLIPDRNRRTHQAPRSLSIPRPPWSPRPARKARPKWFYEAQRPVLHCVFTSGGYIRLRSGPQGPALGFCPHFNAGFDL